MNNILNKILHKPICYSFINSHFRKLLFTSASIKHVVDQNIIQNRSNNQNSELFKDLYLKIQLSGPISIASYMKRVLTHPTKGYYINKDVFGQQGDFTTSPEISQLFGEIIAVWIVSECQKIHNKPFQLVELGPGRGTLARDILRVFRQLGLSNQVSLHLVEISPVLSEIQKKKLCTSEVDIENNTNTPRKHYMKGKTADNVEVFWYKSIVDLPHGFSVFIAQEFFDALPIHKFKKIKERWFEVLIDIDPTSEQKEKFRYVLSKTEACDVLIDKNEKRDHVEISPESINLIKYISCAITQNGGFSLIIDYGHNGDKTDTFRAFRQHKQCDPLSEPGTADLTADVNFALLKEVAQQSRNILCYGPVMQRDFLLELGIEARLMNLCKNATESQKKQLKLGYDKIIDPNEMGSCFKVLSLFPYILKNRHTKFPVYGFQNYVSSN